MSSRSRKKGSRGENEVLKWFYETFSLPARPKRNFEQSSIGGADCIDIPGYAIEVKRQEQLCVETWWQQTIKQGLNHGAFPILVYRQNRRPWTFCLPATLINIDSWGYITLTKDEFVLWFKKRLIADRQN